MDRMQRSEIFKAKRCGDYKNMRLILNMFRKVPRQFKSKLPCLLYNLKTLPVAKEMYLPLWI